MAATAQRQALADQLQVAEYLGLKPHTLENWRSLGQGPKPTKVGRAVRYRWADVEAWLRQQTP